jgi:hypothetical protein
MPPCRLPVEGEREGAGAVVEVALEELQLLARVHGACRPAIVRTPVDEIMGVYSLSLRCKPSPQYTRQKTLGNRHTDHLIPHDMFLLVMRESRQTPPG